jgi:hypothetical protein
MTMINGISRRQFMRNSLVGAATLSASSNLAPILGADTMLAVRPTQTVTPGFFRVTIDGPNGTEELRLAELANGYTGTITRNGVSEYAALELKESNVSITMGEKLAILRRTQTPSLQTFSTIRGVPEINVVVDPKPGSPDKRPLRYRGLVGPHQEPLAGSLTVSFPQHHWQIGQLAISWDRAGRENILVLDIQRGRATGVVSSFNVPTHSLLLDWHGSVRFEAPEEQPLFFMPLILNLLMG